MNADKGVRLDAGESRRGSLARLGYYDDRMAYVVEPVEFDLWVGHDSADGLHTFFDV